MNPASHPPPRSIRGVSYFGNRNPKHFASDLRMLKEAHCNAILLTFSENDHLYYKRTMAELVRMSREEGLQVGLDPWGVGRVFSGEATSEFAFKHRAVGQVFRSGETAPAACPNNPAFLEFILRWIADAADLRPDFLFWDEPRFHIVWEDTSNPQWQVCWCRHCQEAFAAEGRGAFPQAHDDRLREFKDASLLRFVARICRASRDGGMHNTLCLLPCETERAGNGNWEAYAVIPELDVIGTAPYWRAYRVPVLPYVEEQARAVARLAAAAGKEPQLWIQNYNIPEGAEPEVAEAVEATARAGIQNIFAWSFFGTGYMSYIACGNPARVWETLGAAYHSLAEAATV